MRIGMTYDLRSEYLAAGYGEEETAEFDREETIDLLAEAIASWGHSIDRIGSAKRLVERLSAGDRWDLVFNICEGLRGLGRESQVPVLLELYDIPYTFSDPAVTAVCLHKGMTKAIVRDGGLATPRSWTIDAPEQTAAIDGPYPLFAKPIAEGTGKGITPASKISDRSELRQRVAELLTTFGQSVLVETYLPGREFTVGLLGTGERTEVLGTLEIVLLDSAEPEIYSYANKESCEERVEYRLVLPENDPAVAAAERLARDAWIALGCRDGGRIDLRCDANGQPQFLEANPLAGLHPSHSDLPMLATARGVSYRDLIGRILSSASTRVPQPERS